MPAVGSRYSSLPWWRHQMETFSASLAIWVWNSSVTGELPAQRSVTRSYDAFFDLRLNKRLSKESWGWWFETPSRPVWLHCNTVYVPVYVQPLWSRHSADYEVRMIYQSAINIYNVTDIFADLTRLFNIAFRLESFPSVQNLNWNKKPYWQGELLADYIDIFSACSKGIPNVSKATSEIWMKRSHKSL